MLFSFYLLGHTFILYKIKLYGLIITKKFIQKRGVKGKNIFLIHMIFLFTKKLVKVPAILLPVFLIISIILLLNIKFF